MAEFLWLIDVITKIYTLILYFTVKNYFIYFYIKILIKYEIFDVIYFNIFIFSFLHFKLNFFSFLLN